MSQKRSTSFEAAKLAGVSRSTVSFVLNGVAKANIGEATKARVLAAVEEPGCAPFAAGRSLASGQHDRSRRLPRPRASGSRTRIELIYSKLVEKPQIGLELELVVHESYSANCTARIVRRETGLIEQQGFGGL